MTLLRTKILLFLFGLSQVPQRCPSLHKHECCASHYLTDVHTGERCTPHCATRLIPYDRRGIHASLCHTMSTQARDARLTCHTLSAQARDARDDAKRGLVAAQQERDDLLVQLEEQSQMTFPAIRCVCVSWF